jgi:Helix-turn-helix domain
MKVRFKKPAAPPVMLTAKQASERLGVKPETLEAWRARRVGPEYMKLGDEQRSPIRYSQAAIDAYLRERTVRTK